MKKNSAPRELRFITIGLSVITGILFLLLGLGYFNFSQEEATFNWINHTLGVINDLQRFETLVQENGSNHRAYIITGDERYKIKILDLRTELREVVRKLGNETKDNHLQQKNVGQLDQTLTEIFARSALALELISANKKDEVIAMMATGDGQRRLEKLISDIQVMKDLEKELLSQRLKDYAHVEQSSAILIFMASSLDFLLLLIGFYVLRKQLRKRIKIEADLNGLAQIQKTILDSAAFALIAIDKDGHINLFNPAAEKLLGYKAHEVLGKNPSVFHDPSEIAQMAEKLKEELGEVIPVGIDVFTARASRGLTENNQWSYIKKDGTRIQVRLTISALRDEAGEINGFMGIAYDISQQLESEHDMILAKDSALLATKAKSEFLANMSHEIRTPMNAIMGMAELLKETRMDEDQKKYVDIFSRAGESLLNIINDILDLSKIEAGHFELDKSSFMLSSVIEKSVELMALRAHQKQLELAVDISDQLADHFIGDGNRLRQILINLIGNAVKFTRRGEVLLTVKSGQSFADKQEVIFEVQDTGIGMTPEQLQKLFDRFTQADSSITKEFGGTGLGLSITKRLIELMDGKVDVQSTFGIGTRFIISIVLKKDQSFSEEPMEMELKGDRVLVVDDSRTNRMILRKIFEARDALVTEAESGERALELIQEYNDKGIPFNLILMDGRMPGMDGFEVTDMIKNWPSLQGPLLLMLTTDNRSADLSRLRSLGLRNYLIKPVLKKELFSAIQKSILEKIDPLYVPPEEPLDTLPERLSILLADDNDENRMVIVSFLKNYHWKIDETKNGRDALLHFQQNKYDLILMDMQMPVMDGYAATQEIRKIEREKNEVRTPVVALTAYALKEEMEKSLVAGCDDHVAKPVSKSTLIATIDKFTREYTFKIDPDLRELIPDYLEKRRSELREFKHLLENGDFSSIQKLGHKLRGSAGSYGFPILSEAGKELEEGGRDGDLQRIKKALALYETVMARIKVKY